MADSTVPTRAVVLAEIARRAEVYSLPAPNKIQFFRTYLILRFDTSDQVDAWANHFGVTPAAVVEEWGGVPVSWRYQAQRRDWNGRLVELMVAPLRAVTDNKLVPQPAGEAVAR